MDAQQVFKAYEGPPAENPLRFCPVCGAACVDVVGAGGKAERTCTGCGKVHYRNPSPTVTVMVVRDESVLLCLRDEKMFRGGKWCLPGGYMEFDEDFLTAARREVREETGLEVEIKSILSVVSSFHTPEMSNISITLLAEPVSGEAEPRDETQAVQWLPFGAELPEMAFSHHVHIINRYLNTQLVGVPVDPRYAL